MPLVIKKPGGAAKKPAATTRKPAAKSTATKTTTTRKSAARTPAAAKATKAAVAKKTTARKTTAAKKPAATRAKTPANPRGPVGKQLSAADARKAASIKKRHDEITEKKDALVQEIYEFVRDQRADGVSLQAISDSLEMSRQWLYKMGDHQGRGGKVTGTAAPRKPAAKKAPAKSTAKAPAKRTTTAKKAPAKTTAKRTVRKPAASKGGSGKIKINR